MILPAEDPTQLPAPTCPRCGLAASNSYTYERNGIIDAGYVDEAEHLWTVRWDGGAA